jgi:hypothetical protein
MDKENNQIAHRRFVAGRGILRRYGQNNNSPAKTCSTRTRPIAECCFLPISQVPNLTKPRFPC